MRGGRGPRRRTGNGARRACLLQRKMNAMLSCQVAVPVTRRRRWECSMSSRKRDKSCSVRTNHTMPVRHRSTTRGFAGTRCRRYRRLRRSTIRTDTASGRHRLRARQTVHASDQQSVELKRRSTATQHVYVRCVSFRRTTHCKSDARVPTADCAGPWYVCRCSTATVPCRIDSYPLQDHNRRRGIVASS